MANKTCTLEDFHAGQTFTAGPIEVTEESILAYARQFDPQVFHTDPEAAKETFFRGLVASGWHTASLTMSLLLKACPEIAGGMIGIGCDTMVWPRAVKPGDKLSVEVEVLETRPFKSNPLRGLLKVRITTSNQDGLAVQTMETAITAPRKS